MEGKARFVFSRDHRHYRFCRERALTFFNIGWPIAASTAYLVFPFARSFTQRIVAAIERT